MVNLTQFLDLNQSIPTQIRNSTPFGLKRKSAGLLKMISKPLKLSCIRTTHGCSLCLENFYMVLENSKSIFWSYAVLVKGKAIDKLQSPACGYFLFLDLVSCWENFYAMGFSHHSVKPVFNSKLFYYHWIFNSHTQLLCGGGLTFIRVDILGR